MLIVTVPILINKVVSLVIIIKKKKVQNGPNGLKSGVSKVGSFLEIARESCSLPVPSFRGCPHSLACGCLTQSLLPSPHLLSDSELLLQSCYRDPDTKSGVPSQAIQDNLDPFCKVSFAERVTLSKAPAMRTWTFGGL